VVEIEIYTSANCGFCNAAKRLLKNKGLKFTEIDVMLDPSKRNEMIDRTGGSTSVPQVFVNGEYLGDCSEIMELDQEGELDPRLGL
tara:strand:- start:456 stop:713 length:258 start_codon:yes stop_codon:yes gene_type:complete